MRPVTALLAAAVAAASSAPPPPWLSSGRDVDERYRARFDACDAVPDTDPSGFAGRRGCGGDENRVRWLKRSPQGPVAWNSKLAVDLDGSALACGEDRGRMDQCATSLMLPGASGPVPVDADRVPYVVIPVSRPGEPPSEFTRLTGVGVGDFGVVLWHDRTVPVIVADTGPWPKLGEGSLALHRRLGHDECRRRDTAGVCRGGSDDMASITEGVVTVMFPGSARRDLRPDTIEAVVRAEGSRLWKRYSEGIGLSSCGHPGLPSVRKGGAHARPRETAERAGR